MPRKASGLPRSFWCKECAARIRLPKDLGVGSGTRKHYWAKHPEIMRPKVGRGR
jgi:hypothetical protein